MKSKSQYFYFTILLCCINVLAFSQNYNKLETTFNHIIGLDYDNALTELNTINSAYNLEVKSLITVLKNHGQNKRQDESIIEKLDSKQDESLFFKIIKNLTKSYYFLYNSKNFNLSLKYAHNAYNSTKVIDEKSTLSKLIIICILEIYKCQPIHTVQSYKGYLQTFQNLIETKNDSMCNLYYTNEFLSLAYPLPKEYYKVSNKLKNVLEDSTSLSLHYRARFNEAIGVKLRIEANNTDKNKLYQSEKYFKNVINLKDETFLMPYKFHSYLELGHIKALSGNKKQASRLNKKALKYINKSDTLNSLFQYYKWKAYYIHEPLNEIDSCFYALDKAFMLSADLNFYQNTKQLAELNIELDTKEKEKQLLIEQQKKKQNRNIAIGLGGSIILGSIIFFLIQKNTLRKQKLAEQEKELETQKLATVLKEQELVTIDAMIAGQEKERQRIANDLHDDLGGLMANVKLHFNVLRDKKSPELFEKTNKLIDEAYQKIRTVAHAKNSGVIAKQGLLKAVENMANKIADSNTITIDVIDHGLEQRLDNSLELTLFRIIQELTTNVIKHAQATEASIHITNHDDSLNIMVEDNGKGFNPKQVTKTKKGMGISSIDKRIEHLNGTMTIESEIEKGTTVIIDIPI